MYDLSIPTALELMEAVNLTFAPSDDLLTAIDGLVKRRACAAPVVDDKGCLLGMLTEKDCLRILAVSAFDEHEAGRVVDYMSKIRLAIDPGMDLFRVTELFLETNFPMLPVVEHGKLCGEIPRQGALRAAHQLLKQMDREVETREAASGQPRRPRSIEGMQQTFRRLSRDQLVRMVGRKS